MEIVRVFGQLSKSDPSIAGGKGASLGEMTQAGIPIPPGFVILTHAFERFLDEADLNQEIDAVLDTVDHDQIHTVEHASEKIQALIVAAKMPDDIVQEIKTHFSSLGAQYVAVRSSATAEDGSAAAWAGQLDTFLNTTERDLLMNVQRCWASLFTPRAIFYRFEKGMHGQDISVAVVIQKMVESESSGIAFSVHPVTEDYNQLIIEAGFGLGEAIVSGQVTPDSYVVEKEPRRIIDTNVSTQTRGLYRGGAEGNEWRDIPEPTASSQVLSSEQVLELSELVLTIERHYGFPCDIEWAFEKGNFYITQSRPITTLSLKSFSETASVSAQVSPPTDIRQMKWMLGERIPNADIFFFQICFSQFSNDSNHPFIKRQKNVLALFQGFEMLFYVDEADSRQVSESMLQALIQRKELGEELNEKITEWSYKLIDFAKEVAGQDMTGLSNIQLYDIYKTHDFIHTQLYTYGWIPVAIDIYHNVFTDYLKSYLYEVCRTKEEAEEAFLILTTPIQKTIVAEEREEFLKIAATFSDELKAASQGSDISSALSDVLKKHSQKWGHLGYAFAGNQDIFTPDHYLSELIASLRAGPNPEEILIRENEQLRSAEKRQQELYVLLNMPEVYRRLFETARGFALTKLIRRHAQLFTLYILHTTLLEEIAKRIGLTRQEVQFMLQWEVHDALIKGSVEKSEIDARTRSCAFLVAENFEEVYIGDRAENLRNLVVSEKSDSSVTEIRGQTAQRGKVRGIVKIIWRAADMSKMNDNDILVAIATDPDIVPAMKKAAAIVTDQGGITAHAAIVSRELGKPCIIGTKVATQVLKDGDMVEVDADNGVIRILKSNAPIVEELKSIDWYQDWSGVYSQLEASLDRDAYFGIFENATGVRFSRALLTFNGDTAAGWLPTADAEMIGTHLVRRMNDSQFLVEWVTSYRTHADTLMPFFALSPEKFLTKFKEYVSLYPLLAPYVIGTKIAFNMLPLGSEKIATELEAARVYTERFYKDSSVAITALCEYISVRSGYPTKLTRTLTTEDVCTYAETGKLPERAILEERSLRGGMVFVPDFQQALSKEEIDQIFSSFRSLGSENVLQGMIAYRGNVKGICRIVLDYRTAELNEGEVLVTPMTNPYFVPLMKKAAAIVTDGGGMLSHAAIVSRELKKPCIIGTKVATQVLKDGDMVEVDADNGVVRILNHG